MIVNSSSRIMTETVHDHGKLARERMPGGLAAPGPGPRGRHEPRRHQPGHTFTPPPDHRGKAEEIADPGAVGESSRGAQEAKRQTGAGDAEGTAPGRPR